ncbi:hypothetical protein J5I95_22595 [Candidatus Poribacteria bacterium]|nr:hypothetical protein [Candidatus Poribacteria bacterium]
MPKSNLVRISLPDTTYKNTIKFAEHIDCVSNTDNPQPANAIRKVVRTVLNFYRDDNFQQCLENEGIDALAFIQKSVRKQMKESLKEENKTGK